MVVTIIIDFLVAIIAPCIVPCFDFILSKVNIPYVSGKNANSKNTGIKRLNTFIRELPSAFIGNGIWGISYRIKGEYIAIWIIVYLIVLFVSLALLMFVFWKQHLNKIKTAIIVVGILLLILSIIRIIFENIILRKI